MYLTILLFSEENVIEKGNSFVLSTYNVAHSNNETTVFHIFVPSKENVFLFLRRLWLLFVFFNKQLFIHIINV